MKIIKNILFTIFILSTVSVCLGQKSTEMFIPIGQSPGLSGTQTMVGDIQAFNIQDLTCTISTAEGSETIKIIGQPKIWLDNSTLKKRNEYGSLTDIEQGMRVECKFVDQQKRDSIEWIKVAMKDLD